MEEKKFIKCTDCNTLLTDKDNYCPKCESTMRTIVLSFEEDLRIRDQIRGKVKDSSKPKKKRITLDFISGSEQSNNGQWVTKERIVDKDNNQYFEEIKDENNNVIHFCSEKLTEHQGHGNAKFKKNNKA